MTRKLFRQTEPPHRLPKLTSGGCILNQHPSSRIDYFQLPLAQDREGPSQTQAEQAWWPPQDPRSRCYQWHRFKDGQVLLRWARRPVESASGFFASDQASWTRDSKPGNSSARFKGSCAGRSCSRRRKGNFGLSVAGSSNQTTKIIANPDPDRHEIHVAVLRSDDIEGAVGECATPSEIRFKTRWEYS